MSVAIIVKNKIVATLPALNYLALRYIYEKNRMSKEDIAMMMQSVIDWNKKVDATEDERIILGYICTLLDKEEKGKFNERKENFKRHGINWRKFHRLPTEKYGVRTN